MMLRYTETSHVEIKYAGCKCVFQLRFPKLHYLPASDSNEIRHMQMRLQICQAQAVTEQIWGDKKKKKKSLT